MIFDQNRGSERSWTNIDPVGVTILLPSEDFVLLNHSTFKPFECYSDRLLDQREGPIARTIEQQTAKLPSDTFLWAALGAIAVSASLQFMGNRQVSNFVGQWAPTFLILGLYNKMVKQLGSDRTENAI
jgi:hypothetical protein